MRFSELHLIRYGQFDGVRLAFPRGKCDLHVIYGPNEAGKSTTMAAVSDLLFGFPHAAAFDFQFDKQLLRVGGVIDGAGAAMTLRRKRGNVRTLLDPAEQPVDEGPLAALLNGQTRDSFLRAFSLDHTRLRDGGRSMLEAKDDIGQAIFAAGSGLVGVTKLVDTLDEEAKGIWTERATASRTYYVAQRAFDEAKARLREIQLKSAHWSELKKVLDTNDSLLEALRSQRKSLQTALHATERQRRILSPIARREHLRKELSVLGDVPDLSDDAEGVLELALRQISESETTQRLAKDAAMAARDQLTEISFDGTLLNRRKNVTELRAQQGAVDKANRDTPGLKAKVAGATEQLRRLVHELGWDEASPSDIRARLPGRPQISELRALLEEYRSRETTRDTTLDELREQTELATDLQRQLEALTPVASGPGFSAMLQNIRSKGDLELAVVNARERHERARRALDGAMATLSPWRGAAADLMDLQLPIEAETDRLAHELTSAKVALEKSQTALDGLRADREALVLQRAQLVRDEHAISPEMLEDVRQVRDATWTKISAHLSGAAVMPTASDTQFQFSREIQEADDLADRRFDAAELSARLLGIEQALEQLELSITRAEQRLEDAAAPLAKAMDVWSAATRNVAEAISPEGLKAWRSNSIRALQLLEAERDTQSEVSRHLAALDNARHQLVNVLPVIVVQALPVDATLALLLQAATELEVEISRIRDTRSALEARLGAAGEAYKRVQSRRDEAERQMGLWSARWAAATSTAGLDPAASLSLVRARLDLFDEIRSLNDSILGFEQRILDIGNDGAAFAARVQSLADEFGLPHDGDPSAVLARTEQKIELIATLAERAAGLQTQVLAAEARESAAKAVAELARATLSPLLTAAKVEEPADLGAAIKKAQRSKEIIVEIEGLTRSILVEGDGLGLDDLLAEVIDADAIELSTRSMELQEQLDGLGSEIERVAELRQRAALDFVTADERPDAAIAAADLAQARAEMEVQAEAYVRKRSEAALLRWTVERYRREKQAPLLKRASVIFSELTLGRYEALSVEIDDGQPRLSGIRSDGATVVPVTGMSEGTIDQLFLSLRLASVEESVAAGIRLPFLADDLFINYDDARSAAGLRVLARLAEQTQVLFFTHHEHLADLARSTLGPYGLSTCKLGELKMEAA